MSDRTNTAGLKGVVRVVNHPEADEEQESAAFWYEERQPGLDDDFRGQFERTLRRIVADPVQVSLLTQIHFSGEHSTAILATNTSHSSPSPFNAISASSAALRESFPGPQKNLQKFRAFSPSRFFSLVEM